jgi:Tfp pilus assembly protein PilX
MASKTMGSEAMGIDTKGSYGMKSARLHTTRRRITRHTKGFTLIASLLMLLLLSGIAIGLLMMVNTEGRVGGTDLQNNLAFHAAEGGIEKMYSDLAAVFQNTQAPSASAICNVGLAANQPSMVGVTWTQYSATPQGVTCPASSTTTVTSNWGPITSGPNTGLYAQIIPVNMLATASLMGGQEVSMVRQAQVALIPVFQFGVFCDADCSIFPGSPMTFAGAVHANGDFYPYTNGGSTLTFQSKISAFGNVIRTVLPNNNPMAGDKTGTVYVPTANNSNACSTTTTNCTSMAQVGTNYGDGSVTGDGSSAAQPTANVNGAWAGFSNTTTHDMVINGNYYVTGATTPQGTGAKKLSMPFVGGGAQPYEILRRPVAGESATSQLGQSREYNMAQIHVLLSDNPADLPGGASDTNNVRLANVAQTTGNTTVTAYGVTIPAANYPTATFGTPSGTNTYNLYFATASNAIPIPSTCPTPAGNPPTCTNGADWPYAPAAFAGESASQGLQPSGAPSLWTYGNPTIDICPPLSPTPNALPAGCELGVYPYFPLPIPDTPVSGSTLTNYPSQALSNAWNLIDGYLRVEYLNNSGTWVPVTNEWLQLGFARGVTAPTAGSPNPINPNAILLLQEPADRSTNSTLATEPTLSGGSWAVTQAGAPTCTSNNGLTGSAKRCMTWTAGTPAVPSLMADSGVSGGQWAFGVTPAPPATTTPQSLTQFNWYPINFYDAREGEPRDIDWSSVIAGDNSCTANGVMNAVEIDVGNLQNWLAGSIGTSGTSVNSSAQNGYILYFSDRRGMLLNPNLTPPHPANTKSGDSGLEDTINASSTVGTPDGVKETKMSGQTYSPEDDNENGVLDNWGAQNLGLGFYGTVSPANNTTNLNAKIISTNPAPNPYGTVAATGGDRINSCGTTGRKNWVSGARHVLKLVDGSLGNLPLLSTPVVYNGTSYYGGFTVASENPVYIQGDYNSNPTDTAWNTPPVDKTGMAAAAVIADTVTLLSNNWDDRVSMVGLAGNNNSPTSLGNRLTKSTYYRLAIAAGKNMTFQYPTAWPEAGGEDDIGTDGGIHNFLHLLENWGQAPVGIAGTVTENYKGSLASLYYSTYNTGFFKCCAAVYGVPTRNFSFDVDFSVPAGLPPGTPMFRDVESLGYRQLQTTRQASQ